MPEDKKVCDCINHMAWAMMHFDVASELAEFAARGAKPEWAKREEEYGRTRSAEAELEHYREETRYLLEHCGLDLTHVYPFRDPDPERAKARWESYVERAKEISERGGYDMQTFDMLNEALVVGSECKASE